LLVYTERGKALIQGYKFRSKKELGRFFADELVPLFEAIPRPFVIVPVPSVTKKKKKRGWDAVGVIARMLQGLYGYQLLFALRKKPGHDQKGLDYENRLKNLKGRIQYARTDRLPERCVLLDDVFTTGATISECAKVLKEHGAQEVYSVTLALDF
jgi:ComF family protein